MTNRGSAPNPMMAGAHSPTQELFALGLLEAMRDGELPTSDDAEDLHTSSAIGDLRKLIEPADLQWILPLTRASDEKLAGLCISLLAAHSCRPEIQYALRNAWNEATPYIRSVLMWRLLDDPDLPLDWHERLFQFTLMESDLFNYACLRFFGGTEESVIASALERLTSKHIPPTKKWAYLCSVMGLKRFPGAASAIVEIGLTSENEFTVRVARELLKWEADAL